MVSPALKKGFLMKKILLALSLALILCPFASGADLSVGDDAPEFSLPGSDGKTYEIEDFIGKKPVVIAWFPKAFTGG